MLNKVRKWLLKPVFKYTCPVCHEACPQLICESCFARLPQITTQCLQCGLPLPKALENLQAIRCGQCLKRPPSFDTSVTPYHYAQPINQFITRLKFNNKLYYANILADLLIRQIEQHRDNLPECIIPVPLHPARLRQRGFNQALEIARPIAKKYGIKLDPFCCRRVIATSPQMSQDKQARKKNIKNAFKVVGDFNYQHVAIVDDVMTTGHTVNELARVLRIHGARYIQIWATARS